MSACRHDGAHHGRARAPQVIYENRASTNLIDLAALLNEAFGRAVLGIDENNIFRISTRLLSWAINVGNITDC